MTTNLFTFMYNSHHINANLNVIQDHISSWCYFKFLLCLNIPLTKTRKKKETLMALLMMLIFEHNVWKDTGIDWSDTSFWVAGYGTPCTHVLLLLLLLRQLGTVSKLLLILKRFYFKTFFILKQYLIYL